jgi:hypothetical protein
MTSVRKLIPFSAAAADLNSQLSIMNHQLSAGSKPGIDATKKLPGEGCKRVFIHPNQRRPRVRKKIDAFFGWRR